MTSRNMHLGTGFWLLWTLMSTLGFTVSGLALYFPMGLPSGTAKGLVALVGVGAALGAGAGLVLGLAQWLVLRRITWRAGWWIPASVLAMTLAHIPSEALPNAPRLMILVLIIGAALGFGQWLALIRLGWRSLVWVLMTAAGWFVGLAAGIAVSDLLDAGRWATLLPGGGIQRGIMAGVAGIVYGAITGVFMLWLLQPPATPAEEPAATGVAEAEPGR